GRRGGLVLGAGAHDARRGQGPARADPASANLDSHHRRLLLALDRGGASGGLAPPPPLFPARRAAFPQMAQRAGKTRVLPRGLSTVPEWLIVGPEPAPTRWPAAQLPRLYEPARDGTCPGLLGSAHP